MGEFDDIIPEFITESRELLETIEAGLLRLEQGGAQDETVHTVFRAIHSIKGGAGFVGLVKIERLAHKMEDILNLIRNHDLEPSQPITDALLQSLDVLNSLFERVDEHESIDIDGPVRALAAALDSGVDGDLRQQVQAKGEAHPQTGIPDFEVNHYTLINKFKQGNLFLLTLEMQNMEQRGLNPIQLVNEMLSMGEILDSKLDQPVGDAQTYEVSQVAFQVLYATVLDADLLSAALHLEAGELRALSAQDFGLGEEPEAPAAPEPAPQAAAAPAPAPKPRPVAKAAQAPAPTRAEPPAQATAAPAASLPAVTQALPEASGPQPRAGEYLTFSLGDELYGVDILQVQEIIGMPLLTRLPRAPEHMLGVMNLRGMVVPVLDMRLKLNLPCGQENEAVVVVLRVGDKIMGAVVDSVRDVVRLEEETIQNPPDFAGGLRRDYLRGLCHQDDLMIILLELDRLLAQETMSNAA